MFYFQHLKCQDFLLFLHYFILKKIDLYFLYDFQDKILTKNLQLKSQVRILNP